MSNKVKAIVLCLAVALGCVFVALTASGAFFVAGAAAQVVAEQVSLPAPSTVISDAEAGYDQAAYDACVDSAEDKACE